MADEHAFELFEAEADDNEEIFFRVLINKSSVKYITVNAGVYKDEDMTFGPSLASILSEFPPGDWNGGLIAKHAETGQPYFAYARKTQFAGIHTSWHRTTVDYVDLSIGRKLRTGIYEVTFSLFKDTLVAKFAHLSWEIEYLENETSAYQWINGYDIGPQFLGHLSENDRVIGFLMKRVTNARHAEICDLEICTKALSRLHSLGIQHGDVNRFKFLIQVSKAILIDFDTARRRDDQALLSRKLENLPARFNDPSNRRGGGLL